MICNLCPRVCNSIRTETENKTGYCKMPLLPRVARADLHFWEEPCISGDKGSGTIFFSGCSLNCLFCQNFDVSHKAVGNTISIKELSELFKKLEDRGANNINLVTPTHYVYAIIEALEIYKPKIPVVYNSGGYDKPETIAMLKDYIDIYLMDLKYLTKARAQRYSGAGDYPEFAEKSIREAYKQQENCIFKDDIMQKGVIIRHLLLPQGTGEAIKVFDWVRENTPKAYFSIMSQYIPYGEANTVPEINRKVTKREYEKVVSYICNTEFLNVYIQERASSDTKYIPDFETGIN